jgi:putative membrane protein
VFNLAQLPALNASLNAISVGFLLSGYFFIRRRNIVAHRLSMSSAFICSTLFLISYLYYHSQVGSVRFQGEGMIRTVYLTVLLTHSILAAAVPFLAVITLVQALRGRFPSHKKMARWTLPIWLYVSVTGVVVYWMNYRLNF